MMDPRPYIRAQSIAMFIIGIIVYFWPETILSFILNVQTDGVHWHMARCFSSFYICKPFMFWYWTKSDDPSMNTQALTDTILANAFSLSVSWYARIFASEYVYPKVIILLMVYFAIVILFNVYLLLASGWPIGRLEFEPDRQIIQNRLNIFDSYASIIIGILWMAYPDLLLRRQVNFPLTPHHAYICRLFGSCVTASTVFGSGAVYAKNASDRSTALTTRFMIHFFVVLSQLHSQYAYHAWWTKGHWIGMSSWMLWMSIVGMCLFNMYRGKWK